MRGTTVFECGTCRTTRQGQAARSATGAGPRRSGAAQNEPRSCQRDVSDVLHLARAAAQLDVGGAQRKREVCKVET